MNRDYHCEVCGKHFVSLPVRKGDKILCKKHYAQAYPGRIKAAILRRKQIERVRLEALKRLPLVTIRTIQSTPFGDKSADLINAILSGKKILVHSLIGVRQ
jgi:hypothetical protein